MCLVQHYYSRSCRYFRFDKKTHAFFAEQTHAYVDLYADFVRALIGEARAVKLAQTATNPHDSSHAMDIEDVLQTSTQPHPCNLSDKGMQSQVSMPALKTQGIPITVIQDVGTVTDSTHESIAADTNGGKQCTAHESSTIQPVPNRGAVLSHPKSLFSVVKDVTSDCIQRDQAA